MSSDRVQHLCDEIRAAREEVLGIVSGLAPEQFDRSTVNEGWTVRDTLSHLATIPLRNMDMWRCVLDGQPWTAEKSVDDFSRKRVEERRGLPGQAVVDEYRRTTDEQIAFLSKLSDADLDREWDHPAASIGRTTLETMILAGPRHHRKHGAEIQAATS
jgi:uncharacterized damage-inducible protein DinB